MRQLHERPDHSAALGIDRLAAVWDSTASGSPSLSKLQSPGLHAHEPSKFFTVLEHCRPRDADSAQVQDNDDVGAALRKTGACRPPSTPPVPNLSDDVQVAVPGSQHSAFGDDMCAGKEASGLAVITETARCCWTPVLHERFMASVEQLGGLEVVKPAALLKHMGVPRLSLGHVKSHLQKCRKEHQRGIVPRPARSPRSKTLRPDKVRPGGRYCQLVDRSGMWIDLTTANPQIRSLESCMVPYLLVAFPGSVDVVSGPLSPSCMCSCRSLPTGAKGQLC